MTRVISLNIMSYFRASVMGSSISAFSLALADSDNINFARKIITVKNQNAHCRLINLHSNNSECRYTEQKISQYKFFLGIIDSLESLQFEDKKYQ